MPFNIKANREIAGKLVQALESVNNTLATTAPGNGQSLGSSVLQRNISDKLINPLKIASGDSDDGIGHKAPEIRRNLKDTIDFLEENMSSGRKNLTFINLQNAFQASIDSNEFWDWLTTKENIKIKSRSR